MLPTHIYHADWGTDANKRWLARAKVRSNGRYTAESPFPLGDQIQLLTSIRGEIGADGYALLGFDFPIGIPAAYARLAGVTAFKPFLRKLGKRKWASFYTVASVRSEISVHRPFYPFRPGGTRQTHLLQALAVQDIDDLRRQCERKQSRRRAACSLFWTLGPNQVGKGAIVGWRDVLAPALSNGKDVLLWPFDGDLDELLLPGKIVVVETYPAECYGWFFPEALKGKGKPEVRRKASGHLLTRAQLVGLELEPTLADAIKLGFPEGDDAFDAIVGLFGIIEVVMGKRETGEPCGDKIRKLEGWILGEAIR